MSSLQTDKGTRPAPSRREAWAKFRELHSGVQVMPHLDSCKPSPGDGVWPHYDEGKFILMMDGKKIGAFFDEEIAIMTACLLNNESELVANFFEGERKFYVV